MSSQRDTEGVYDTESQQESKTLHTSRVLGKREELWIPKKKKKPRLRNRVASGSLVEGRKAASQDN